MLSENKHLGRVWPHRLPLAFVVVACAIGQLAVLLQTPLVAWRPDSSSYTQVADQILHHFQFVDALRTPTYPTFLAVIFVLTGGEHLGAVVLAQTGLTLITILEIYLLAYRVSASRWQAGVVACLIGVNPFVTNWERCILPEALTFWLVVTLCLVFERYLRHERPATLAMLAFLLVATIMARPQYLYLPAVVAGILVYRRLRQHSLSRGWKELVVVGAIPIMAVCAYCATNAAVSGYLGLSDITNLNLFGKVIEYHMLDMSGYPADPSFARFRADIAASAAAWDPHAAAQNSWVHQDVTAHLWDFVQSHPQYDVHHRAMYGAYSGTIIVHHPLYYIEMTAGDVMAATYAGPQLSADFSFISPWIAALFVLFSFLARMYAFLPALLIAGAVSAWRHADRPASLMVFALVLAITGNIIVPALTDFTEFWRLRFPTDWSMTLVATLLLVAAVQSSARALAAVRRR
jgi:hypothetical protein